MNEDAVAVAMVETRLWAETKKQINSFGYFVAELEYWSQADLDPGFLRAIAKIGR